MDEARAAFKKELDKAGEGLDLTDAIQLATADDRRTKAIGNLLRTFLEDKDGSFRAAGVSDNELFELAEEHTKADIPPYQGTP